MNKLKKLFKLHVLPISIMLIMLFAAWEVRGEGECSRWDTLSDNQKHIAYWLRERGEPYNLGLTLPAIAMAESNLGLYRLNIDSRDIGLMQINYKTGANILGVTNHYKKIELYQKLIYDDDLNVTLAIKVLKHFEGKGWKNMVISYNIGNNTSPSYKLRGDSYYKKVSNNLKVLKRCMDDKR